MSTAVAAVAVARKGRSLDTVEVARPSLALLQRTPDCTQAAVTQLDTSTAEQHRYRPARSRL